MLSNSAALYWNQLEQAVREMVLRDLNQARRGGPEVPARFNEVSLPDFLRKYLTWKNRQITARPRRVHFSQALLQSHQYLSHYWQVESLATKLRMGEDVSGHLSTGALPANIMKKPDMLLSDWGIHHLHLSSASDSSRHWVNNRTSETLWILLAGDSAYLVGIFGHKKPMVFDGVVETIIREWNGAGVYHRSRTAVGLAFEAPKMSLEQARNGRINLFHEVDGNVWMLTGMTCSGGSMMVTDQVNSVMINFKRTARYLEQAEASGGSSPLITWDSCSVKITYPGKSAALFLKIESN